MPRFRDIVATELANQQIPHNHFLALPERSSEKVQEIHQSVAC